MVAPLVVKRYWDASVWKRLCLFKKKTNKTVKVEIEFLYAWLVEDQLSPLHRPPANTGFIRPSSYAHGLGLWNMMTFWNDVSSLGVVSLSYLRMVRGVEESGYFAAILVENGPYSN